MRHAMIMAGGSGTRLWPMSRGNIPKQLIGLFDGQSLLEIATNRIQNIVSKECRWICANEKHSNLICQTISAINKENIIGEPEGRDTLNAVGLTAAILQHQDPDAIFAVLTSDHIITPQEEFESCLNKGFELIEQDNTRFVTFGITPTRPATGYGYIELGNAIDLGAAECKRFVEKPDLATAQKYLDSGQFAWNSGMFIFHAKTFLDALSRLQPETYEGFQQIIDSLSSDLAKKTLKQVYPTLNKISVDYGIMEPAASDNIVSICTVPMQVQWLDVGSWTSYSETLNSNKSGNKSNAKHVHLDSTNTLCFSDNPEHTIATIGCQNLIIVHTQDATLVFPASEAERVKELHGIVDASLQ